MAKPKRLSPQPTNTRLARFVGRMFRRWPLAFASTVRARDSRIASLHQDLCMTHERQRAIHHDMTKIMRKLTPPMASFEVSAQEVDLVMYRADRIGLHFSPVFMQVEVDDRMKAHRLSDHTTYLARQIARELARHHADEVARITERHLRDLFLQREKVNV